MHHFLVLILLLHRGAFYNYVLWDTFFFKHHANPVLNLFFL